MKPFHYVIIGNGVAANRAAEVIRRNHANAKITLISREFFLFYYRHKLPPFVTGKIDETALQVYPVEYYRERNIRLRLGQIVQKVDLQHRIVYLKHMEKVHYDRLLICAGGRSYIPEMYYPFRSCFTTLKRLSTARIIRDKLPSVQTVVIVGGDLTSVKLAETLIETGRHVTFVLDDYAFWPLESASEIRESLENALRKMGADVISNDPIHTVKQLKDDDPPLYEVQTQSGKTLQAHMVGAFFGFKPDIDFLIRSGLDIDRGILVNDQLKTAFDDVYAAGDCAQIYAPELKNYWVSVGWKNAFVQGEAAALNMVGLTGHAEKPAAQATHFKDIKLSTPWWHIL
jgi:NADPH-dependent 2,4-dienoyl-CoA reductase/sulfur reductase-like enzyme